MAITTAEELLRTPDLGRCELVAGELIMMTPAGGEHGEVTMLLGLELAGFVRSRWLGKVFAAETGFVLTRDPDTVLAPDASFVRPGREVGRGFIEGPPDLAVEVLSPSDRPKQVLRKVAAWLAGGAQAVWVVDPRTRTVTVHASNEEPRVLRACETLTGGDLLPGFELVVGGLFEVG